MRYILNLYIMTKTLFSQFGISFELIILTLLSTYQCLFLIEHSTKQETRC